MSYILDALRKAEQQRPPAQGPELFQVPGPRGAGGGTRGWVIAAVAAVAGVAIGVAAWLALAPPRHEAQPAGGEASAPLAERIVEATQPPPPAVEARPAPAAVVEPPRPSAPAAPGRARPTARGGRARARAPGAPTAAAPRAAAALAAGDGASDLEGQADTVRRASRPEGPSAMPSPAPPGSAAVPVAPAAPAPRIEPLPEVEAAAASPVADVVTPGAGGSALAEAGEASLPPEEQGVAEPPVSRAPAGDASAAPGAASAPAPPQDGRVLALAALPAEVLAAWPNVALAGHVWSEEQELRLVVVDGRIVREGGDAAPGVGLERITPEGAVFGFRGWRVLVEAP